MSNKFNGFTQNDIQKITSKPTKQLPKVIGIRRQVENIKPLQTKTEQIDNNSTTDESFDNSISFKNGVHFRPLSPIQKDLKDTSDGSILHIEKENEKEIQKIKLSQFKGVSLKDFESHRKVMEEQNKQKTEILYKAIDDYSRKTAAEAKRINEIKAELEELDNNLAADVIILRNEIEAATICYSNIEKQYNQIESQFLQTKLNMQRASEKKELLTDHLCQIITHNEDRKAQKLTELMEKFGISPSDFKSSEEK